MCPKLLSEGARAQLERNIHLRMRRRQLKINAKKNAAENWMAKKLRKSPFCFKRQAPMSGKFFDFFCQRIGVAVEVDGDYHREKKQREKDAARDTDFLERLGILTLRVPAFDEKAAQLALDTIYASEFWRERKERLGIFERRKVILERNRQLRREKHEAYKMAQLQSGNQLDTEQIHEDCENVGEM